MMVAAVCLSVGGVVAGQVQRGFRKKPSSGAATRSDVQVRLLQAAVSVLEPKGAGAQSVPGLKTGDFRVRMDGRWLGSKQFTVDAICGESTSLEAAGSFRPILIIADFNYIDAAGRARVAEALRKLAERAEGKPYRYKVYGLTRQARLLTSGFTNHAGELRGAASLVESTSWRGAADGGTEYAPRLSQLMKLLGRDGAGAAAFSEGEKPGEGSSGFRGKEDPELTGGRQRGAGHQGKCRSGCGCGGCGYGCNLLLQREVRARDSWIGKDGSHDPAASLALIKAILDAHLWIPGRKAVVLFSGESFRFVREERLQAALEDLKRYYASSYVFWTVDTGGVGRKRAGASELLSAMGMESGGGVIRGTGDLELGIRRAEESLACYYLVSVKLPEGDPGGGHRLDVRLDTKRRKELWRLRVVAPRGKLRRLPARSEISREVAALFMPEEFRDFPASVEMEGPVQRQGARVVIVRAEAELDGPEGRDYKLALAVDRDDGLRSQPVCRFETPEDAPIHVPASRKRRGRNGKRRLVAEVACSLEEGGLLTARAVFRRADSGEIGAARVTGQLGGKQQPREAPRMRVRVADCSDLVWRPGMDAAKRNSRREVYRVEEEEAPEARVDERVAVDRLWCGEGSREEGNWHALVGRGADGRLELLRAYRPEDPSIESFRQGPCRRERLVIPEYSFEPGSYALIELSGKDVFDDLAAHIGRGEPIVDTAGVVAFALFRVGDESDGAPADSPR